MFKKLVSLFILLSIACCFANEVNLSFLDSHEGTIVKSEVADTVMELPFDECEDCHDEGCCDKNNHCPHHSSHSCNYIESKHVTKLSTFNELRNKTTFYFYFHYDEPFLDPSLKPPLFS